MRPYYQDESVTLYHGDCLDVLPKLNLSGSVHLLTDPPYFKVKDDDWDNQWSKQADFLDWMGQWLDAAKPHLSPDASVWVFASPEMASAVESVVGQRLHVLNSIRWAKTGGDNLRRVSLPAMRRFVSIWEGIIFAEVQGNGQQTISDRQRKESLAPFAAYLMTERLRAGFTRREVGALFPSRNSGKVTGLVDNWELGYSFPSKLQYEAVRDLLNGRGGDFLSRPHAELVEAMQRAADNFESRRRLFDVRDRRLSEDIWHFGSVSHYPGKHPCEKPLSLLTHIIETTTRPGDTILDCFAGSGAVLEAARQCGRNAVGIEKDNHWVKHATERLAQPMLDFEGRTA